MNELITQTIQLPDTLEDLSKFVLVGREKLTSVRAEIRAINKLELAEEVRKQKKEEALMLSEALLDAEVKLGDLLKQIPRKTSNQYLEQDSGVALNKEGKTKLREIADLGFSPKQAQRFETLANNKDLVEQVKAEARENDDIPTRSRVLDLAKARKQKQQEEERSLNEYSEYLANCKKYINKLEDIMYKLHFIPIEHNELKMINELIDGTEDTWIGIIEDDISKLQTLLRFLKGRGKN